MPTEGNDTRLYRLSRTISKRTNVPPAVVERVLIGLVGVVLETLGRDEKFVFPHFLSITPNKHRVVVPERNADGYQSSGKVYEDKSILRVGLSGTIRRLNIAQHELWADQPGLVNTATWRDALAYLKQTGFWSRPADMTINERNSVSQGFSPATKTSDDSGDPLFDALLGDDDDDI